MFKLHHVFMYLTLLNVFHADNSPSNKDLFLNTYYDTASGFLSSSQYCEDISNNCNNLVKFRDGTVFNFFPGTDVKFDDDDKKCAKMKDDYKLETEKCDKDDKRMVCYMDCCMYLYNLKEKGFLYLYRFHS